MSTNPYPPVKVGILGLGTVGGGVTRVLARNAEEISRRAGREIIITHAAARNLDTTTANTAGMKLTGEALEVVDDPDVSIIVELMGGYEPARSLVLRALANGKHVVTANKALIAKHGNEIFAAARVAGMMVGFEAAVAGGIPIIKAIREGLAGNRLEWVAGIINGTANFILTEMRDKSRDFQDAGRSASARIRRGRPDLRYRRHRRRPQADDPRFHRVRHPPATRQGLCRRHQPHHPRRRGLRRTARLPHQTSRHGPSR
jgi:homoserine dehydrogenase